MKIKRSNLVLIGMPGAGKTAIGKILAEEFKMDFYDLDEYIEKEAGKSINDIFLKGEKHFRRLEKRAVKKLSKTSNTVLATGGGVVLNPKNIRFLKRNGLIVFIDRPIKSIALDIDTSKRPLLARRKRTVEQIYRERYELYKKYADYQIKNSRELKKTIEELCQTLGGLLNYENINYQRS